MHGGGRGVHERAARGQKVFFSRMRGCVGRGSCRARCNSAYDLVLQERQRMGYLSVSNCDQSRHCRWALRRSVDPHSLQLRDISRLQTQHCCYGRGPDKYVTTNHAVPSRSSHTSPCIYTVEDAHCIGWTERLLAACGIDPDGIDDVIENRPHGREVLLWRDKDKVAQRAPVSRDSDNPVMFASAVICIAVCRIY